MRKQLVMVMVMVMVMLTATVLAPITAFGYPGNPNSRIRASAATAYQPSYNKALVGLKERTGTTLTPHQLQEFKKLLAANGWPTVIAVGKDGVNAAGGLVARSTRDYALQDELEQVIGARIDIDVNALAFASLVDKIEFHHDGTQQFGTLLSVTNGKVKVSPPVSASKANSVRDLTGLPLLGEYVDSVQEAVNRGRGLGVANPIPPLATDYQGYSRPELRQRLGEMIGKDQAARRDLMKAGSHPKPSLVDKVRAIDASNLGEIKKILYGTGFPTIKMVGRDGVSTFFLLVQHADEDHALQKHALKLAKPLLLRHELSRQAYALLTDRVLIGEGKKQLYGSQVRMVDGRLVPFAISYPDALDVRRAKMALPSEASYLDSMKKGD